MLADGQPHRSVVTLMTTLLTRTRDANVAARLALARALGLLGAIDPARLRIPLRAPATPDHSTSELAIVLINNFLVGELGAARSDMQDRVAFAIQFCFILLLFFAVFFFFYKK